MSDAVFHYEPAATRQTGDVVVLDGAEGQHAASAKRLRVGEVVLLTDGRGTALRASAAKVGRRDVTFEVLAVVRKEAPPLSLTVVQAVVKGDRGERAVELLTEVGVGRIVPWQAERSVTRWTGDRAVKAHARWQSTVAAAAKQSRRLWWPEVMPVQDGAGVVELIGRAACAYVLHESADRALVTHLEQAPARAVTDLLLVVGPEGGVSPAELRTFTDAGALPVRLGPTVLRASTAGVVAAALVLSRTDQWRTVQRTLDEGAARD